MRKPTAIGLVAITVLVSAAFAPGCKDENTRAHDAFLDAIDDWELGNSRMSDVVRKELRPLFKNEKYWALVQSKRLTSDSGDDAIKTAEEINETLIKNGTPRLERYQLLELNRIRLAVSGRSVSTCAAMWRGTATSEMIFEHLELQEARSMAALAREAALHELSSSGRPPMEAGEIQKALGEGIRELMGKNRPDGNWCLREVAFGGKPLTDNQACTLFQVVVRNSTRLKADLQDRFLHALYSPLREAN